MDFSINIDNSTAMFVACVFAAAYIIGTIKDYFS
jgi:hypothetical protein